MIILSMFKHDDKFYILMSADGQSIRGFATIEEALGYWERGYENSIQTGYTGLMSACIHHTRIQPSIVTVDDLTEIERRLVDLPVSSSRFDHSFIGMPATKKDAKDYWERGTKPNLLRYRS